MKYLHATLAFIFMFVVCFVIGGLVLKRLVPQSAGTIFNPFAQAYWTDNWEGLVAGLLGGVFFARRTLKQYDKRAMEA